MAVKHFLLAASLTATVLAAPVVEERQNCASEWGQCGGIDWNGATCCESGTTCSKQNDWYSQCLRGSQQVTTTTTSTTTQPTNPPTTDNPPPTTTTPPTGTVSGTVSYTGNPFSGVALWANSYYASEVANLAIPSMSGAMATKAAEVAKVPSFEWLDTAAKVPRMVDTLSEIRAANQAGANPPYAAQLVVYDLPDRDCAAAASNGEYAIADGGEAKYKAYIDAIREQLVAYSDVRAILVIEPDSLANLITNMDVPKCVGAHDVYLELTNYAVKQLNLPNVAMYLDAGHAGWLGWEANLQPAVNLFAGVYKDAGQPAALRGLATNVANYNGWSLSSPPPYTEGNAIYDESRYVQAMAPLLHAAGFPAHFITDTGRSGRQPTGQQEWGNWCNVKDTGFGVRPTTNTGLDVADAFVWIKPGGECDGTSDTSAARYDFHCGLSDALQPAPEAGHWFQAYFEMLLTNANPPF